MAGHAAGRDKVARGFIKGHVVADAGRGDGEPCQFLHAADGLFFPFDVGAESLRRRIGVFLHHGVLVVKLVHRLDDFALSDVAEQIVQPLLEISCAHARGSFLGLLVNVIAAGLGCNCSRQEKGTCQFSHLRRLWLGHLSRSRHRSLSTIG